MASTMGLPLVQQSHDDFTMLSKLKVRGAAGAGRGGWVGRGGACGSFGQWTMRQDRAGERQIWRGQSGGSRHWGEGRAGRGPGVSLLGGRDARASSQNSTVRWWLQWLWWCC